MFNLFVSETSKTANRRQSERKTVDAAGELIACPATSKTAPVPVHVRDVSATGVGIVVDNPLPVGQKFVVKQDSFPTHQPRLYTVVRADQTETGQYNVGLHASQLLDPRPSAESCCKRSSGNGGTIAMSIAFTLILVATAAAMFL